MFNNLLDKLTLKKKLAIFITGGAIYTIFMIVINYKLINNVSQNFSDLRDRDIKLIELVDSAKHSLSFVQQEIVKKLNIGYINGNSHKTDIDKLLPSILEKLNSLNQFAKATRDTKLIKISEDLNYKYIFFSGKAIDLFSYEKDEIELKTFLNKLEELVKISTQMNGELNNLIIYGKDGLNSGFHHLEESLFTSIFILVLVGVFSIISFIAVGVIFFRSINSRIKKLVRGTEEFSKKNFAYRIEIDCEDEFCKLSSSFNNMAFSIERLLDRQKRANDILDEKVREKTKKLNEYSISLEEKVSANVKELREKDKILIHQSKMASMGEMIGNIAHQWRQPLNALSLVLHKITVLYETERLTQEKLDNALLQGNNIIEKMSDTIDDFRNFFNPNNKEETFLVSKVFEDVFIIVSGTFQAKDIQLNYDFKEDFEVRGFRGEFSQVLLNILNNARDVLLEKEIKSPVVDITIDKENKEIHISDNGGGIPSDVLPKVFEPYFTTKFKSEGTGIGLYMSKMIIEEHMKGKLSTTNSESGAVFTISF